MTRPYIDPALIAQAMSDDVMFEAIVSLRVAEERFQRCWDEAEAIARKYRAMPTAPAVAASPSNPSVSPLRASIRHFVEVPPPEEAPIYDDAAKLGLVRGLSATRARSACRCSWCSGWVKADEWLVWVPDSVRRNDPVWAVEEQCRLNAYNGYASGWCLKCAPKAERVKPGQPSFAKRKSFLARIFGL